MKPGGLRLLLKGFVSLGLLVFLFSRIDLDEFLQTVASAHLFILFLVFSSYFLSQLISSHRWALLARPLGFRISFRQFFYFYFIGMFFNLFAPSTVGGDVGRVYYLSRGGTLPHERPAEGPTAHAFVSVIADRGVGMVVLVWMGAVALLLSPGYGLPGTIRLIVFTLAILSIVGWVSLPILSRFLERREHPMGRNLHVALETFRAHPRVVLQTVGLSVGIHLIQGATHVLLGAALNMDLPWSYAFILYPLVGVFSALPVSLNGIGLREGGYLYLLSQIGVVAEKAIAFGLLWFLVVVLDSLIGGAIFILFRGSSAIPDPMKRQAR